MSSHCEEPEKMDDSVVLFDKVTILANLMKTSKKTIIFTGAGISTSANIQDYVQMSRNPKPLVMRAVEEQELEYKMPTFAHFAVHHLLRQGFASRIVTSNHDNLHVKCGTPESQVIDLFGNVFVEKCCKCQILFRRNVIVGTLGRICEKCGGRLMQIGTRMGAMTPEIPLQMAIECSKDADLALVLGSSMRVSPFCDIAMMCKNVCIVNLKDVPQQTKLKIFAPTDSVLKLLLSKLDCLDSLPITFKYRLPNLLRICSAELNEITFEIASPFVNEPPKALQSIRLTISTDQGTITPEFELGSDEAQRTVFISKGIISGIDNPLIRVGVIVEWRSQFEVPPYKGLVSFHKNDLQKGIEFPLHFEKHLEIK